MNQSILYRYFKGNASEKEEREVLKWVNESDDNYKTLQKERLLYDIALFSEKKQQTRLKINRRVIPIIRWGIQIAAVVLICLSSYLLLNEHQYSSTAHVQTMTVPAGQRAQITLPDGTRIWLNSKSSISYAADFGRKERTIDLDGEAYFEVAKNKKIPFYVNTETNKVRVVGTTFNVCAYKGSNEFETTLVEGFVDIYPANSDKLITHLVKNELFSARGAYHKKSKVTSYDNLRWKEGFYCFDDSSFKEILDKLEKYYNISVTINNTQALDYRCTGKFKEQDGPEHILKVIQKDHKFTYRINDEKDSIFIK
ncbi:FecR family protein [uncultured Bacteroides sp.]|uniref:FecR family protein n=1 Tax=uncultured Bacteroides sp. TaxID=162156 RepID=UPI002AA7387E|nr:FecR family protein [uncultured Bacteroides sp.]